MFSPPPTRNPSVAKRFSALCGAIVAALIAISCAPASPKPALSTLYEQAELVDPATPWTGVEAQAKGETVYWNAWAGDERVNTYMAWAANEVERRFGVHVVHVKTQDMAESVNRILGERQAGRDQAGSVDLLWINGENFAALKGRQLLLGPFAARLPAAKAIALDDPLFLRDFTIPVEGYEAPWGRSLFVFTHDAATLPDPPKSFPALLDWARKHPGKFTYPAPPDFIGSTFLKQAMLSLHKGDAALFAQPVTPETFTAATGPLFAYLDALHPFLWRKGRVFPNNGPAQRQLFADQEVSLTMAFNPAEVRNAIAAGQLASTSKSYAFETGSIANAHYLAIPYNANAAAGALVVINFLLSPEAQARKADSRIWGDAPVLALDRLKPEDRARFTALGDHAELAIWQNSGPILNEPHPSWMEALEAEWLRRYGGGQQ